MKFALFYSARVRCIDHRCVVQKNTSLVRQFYLLLPKVSLLGPYKLLTNLLECGSTAIDVFMVPQTRCLGDGCLISHTSSKIHIFIFYDRSAHCSNFPNTFEFM